MQIIDKFNAEGYYDLVTYEALSRIEKEERVERKVASDFVYSLTGARLDNLAPVCLYTTQ